MSSSAVKVLLVGNSADSNSSKLLPFKPLTILEISEAEHLKVMLHVGLTLGNVLIVFVNNNGGLGLATLRSGQSLGQAEWIGGGYGSYDRPSILFYQNGPLVGYRWEDSGYHSVVSRASNWSSTGIWTNQSAISGPLGATVTASYAPAICPVGKDWIYSFYFGGNSPSSSNNIYYNVIDLTGLTRSSASLGNTSVWWNSYYTVAQLSNSDWSGVPTTVVTGSSTMNWKIHIFAVNTENVLHYFYIPLQPDGLPLANKVYAPDRYVDCYGEVAIATTSGGAITAFTHNGNLHVLYPNAQGNLVGVWRGNDSGNWTTATLPENISVGNDPIKGGVDAVIVQIDF